MPPDYNLKTEIVYVVCCDCGEKAKLSALEKRALTSYALLTIIQ
jgi:hypothetical protein